jgi:hypothetical protein
VTVRRVKPETMWRVARATLGRMACEYGDPLRDSHNHADCLVDDESYAADLILGVCAAVVVGDDSKTLDQVTALIDAVARPEPTVRPIG